MLRKEIEDWMKKQKIQQIDIIYNESDKLAMYCTLQGGYLVDCWNHRVNRKIHIWGYLRWVNGKSYRVAF